MVRYEDAKTQKTLANHWSASENNSNNAWHVNFNSGNLNNNNKYNGMRARAVAAFGEDFGDFCLSVVDAYEVCLKNKARSRDAENYMRIASTDLYTLAYELYTGTYKPSTSVCFMVTYPKLREVFAANFRDRVVHHWMNLRVEPIFEKRHISNGNVSHACRKGFGTITAVKSVAEGVKRVTNNYREEAWIIKGDFKSFFMSLDKKKLCTLVTREIKRKCVGKWKDILIRTMETTIMHCPELDCVINSDPVLWEDLEPSKSQFRNGENMGQPIGNLPTQQNANFMLSFFDLMVRFLFRRVDYAYARLVDDFEIVCKDLPLMQENFAKLEDFSQSWLGVQIHKNKKYIQPASHGSKFVGCVIKNHRIYISNRTVARAEERVHGFNELLRSHEMLIVDLERIESVLNSYLGLMRHWKTYKIRQRLINKLDKNFWKYFYVKGSYHSVRIKKKYKVKH